MVNEKNGRDIIEPILAKIAESSETLYMCRVPIKTKKEFIQLSKDEFCGDYGLTLKYLMDDMVSADTQMLNERIDSLENRLRELEIKITETKETDDRFVKTVDGKIKQVKA